jgi:hypothetical protein
MKKIIALAVAGAFVAPTYAADVTLGGEIEYAYINGSGTTEDIIKDMETNLFISATTELNNGFSLTGSIPLRSNSEVYTEGGSTLTIGMADMGTLVLGDGAGPLDSYDDKSDNLMVSGSGASGYNDMGIVYTLPSFVEGLEVKVGMSPAGSNSVSGSTSSNISNDTQGIAAQYNTGSVTVYLGQENTTSSGTETETMGYGGSFSVMNTGLGVQFDVEENDVQGSQTSDTDMTSVGLTYSLGDGLGIAYYARENKTNDVLDGDEAGVVLTYAAGAGVKVYLENFQDDLTANSDATSLGIEYKF